MANIYEIYGSDAHSMTISLMQAAQVSKLIPPGASIALKPNLVLSGTPDTGATTHPGVLSGCIEYLQQAGFTQISVIESSWVGGNTERAMKVCGYDKVCARYGVPFYDLKKDQTRTVQTALRPMEITCRALDADFLIDLPVLKGHCQTAMTCALKNLKGCLPDREKRRFHSDGLIEPIAALGAVLKPALVIVDSICGDLNFEEGGNPVLYSACRAVGRRKHADPGGGYHHPERAYEGCGIPCGVGTGEASDPRRAGRERVLGLLCGAGACAVSGTAGGAPGSGQDRDRPEMERQAHLRPGHRKLLHGSRGLCQGLPANPGRDPGQIQRSHMRSHITTGKEYHHERSI